MDFFKAIELATQQWKLAHQPINAGRRGARPEAGADDASSSFPAPITFADVPLGEEFIDEHGCTWEKRSEKRAISWIQYESPEVADFSPTDPVRLK